MNLPRVVSAAEWQVAHDRLREKEKEATRARDALAAERRRLPMVRFDKDYAFEGPDGSASLLDLFEGPRQLIVYHFMFAAGAPGWPSAGCDGCSMFVDNVGHLAHLHARDTSFALVSEAPVEKIQSYRQRMGWTIPWLSLAGNEFNPDCGLRPERLPARRRRRLSHLFHDRARGRGPRQQLDLPRPDPTRATGGLGGVARRPAADPAVRVVAPPRRVFHPVRER
jgi:predicted dithiol-disulfide oxidoreductase (DUF899 family)